MNIKEALNSYRMHQNAPGTFDKWTAIGITQGLLFFIFGTFFMLSFLEKGLLSSIFPAIALTLVTASMFFIVNPQKKSAYFLSKSLYTGSLYDLFDKECPYTKIILRKNKDNVQKETLKNKGLTGTYLLKLEREINELKNFALTNSEMNSVASLNKIITNRYEINYDFVDDDDKKANIISEVTSCEKNRNVDKMKVSSVVIAFFSVFILIMLSMVIFAISSVGVQVVNFGRLIPFMLSFFGIILLMIVLRNIPFNKPSERKLENVFDFNCEITQKVLKKYEWELYTDYVKNRGFLNRTLWFIKREINYNKRNPIESGLDKEEAAALINNNTKLGDLLVDIKNI